jgi:hypothetical protein
MPKMKCFVSLQLIELKFKAKYESEAIEMYLHKGVYGVSNENSRKCDGLAD